MEFGVWIQNRDWKRKRETKTKLGEFLLVRVVRKYERYQVWSGCTYDTNIRFHEVVIFLAPFDSNAEQTVFYLPQMPGLYPL